MSKTIEEAECLIPPNSGELELQIALFEQFGISKMLKFAEFVFYVHFIELCKLLLGGLMKNRLAFLQIGDPWVYQLRSEERGVGKECRSRWSPYH